MNRKLFLPLALACALFTSSCKTEESEIKTNTVLAVDENAVDFAYTTSKQVILVTTDATTWSTSVTMNEQKEALWCLVTKGAKDITIRLKENFKKEVRTAVIKVEAPGLKTVEITVTQAAALVERDPFWSEYDGGEWDNTWTYYDAFLHQQGGEDKWKFDPVVYDKPVIPASWWVKSMGPKITSGLKLDSKFLTEFNARHIYRLELSVNGPAKVTFAILKKTSVVTNTGAFPSYISETVRTEELWRSNEITAPTDVDTKPNWWAICDASTAQNIDFALKQTDGEIYLVAYTVAPAAANFTYCRQQLNPLVQSFVSFTDVTGQDLYRFIGGTACLNFYMSEPK